MHGRMKHMLRISVRKPERRLRNKLLDVQNREDQVILCFADRATRYIPCK